MIDEISSETARVIEPHTETILRAVLRLLPPLAKPAVSTATEGSSNAIRALSRNHPPRRIGDGCYLVGGFAIVTSDPLDEEPNP